MQILGVIPARGGSKAIPDKNVVTLCGRPLLAYTADAALRSRRLSQTIVSTESETIASTARTLGLHVPFLRPASLAADDTPMLPVLQHALTAMAERGFRADVLVLLQPTSPLRREDHIDATIDLLDRTAADSVVSVVEVPHQFNPTSVMCLENSRLRPFLEGPTATRRQDKPQVFARNGPAVLAVRAGVLSSGSLYGDDCRALVMDAESSLDIDTAWDLTLAELVLNARVRTPVV